MARRHYYRITNVHSLNTKDYLAELCCGICPAEHIEHARSTCAITENYKIVLSYSLENATLHSHGKIASLLGDVACGCIMPQSTGGNVLPDLYPFIAASYFTKASPPLTVNQSEAVSIDYVLVTDYPPAVLPTGQLLSSNINPPTHNQGIYQPGGFSLTQYIQFEAWQIGQGNIYAGGLFMTGIFLLIITAGLGGVFLKLKLGMSIFGMIWNISTLAFVYLMFFTGVLPLMVPILVSIGAAAIFFGIFRSGPPASGGEITG